MKLVISLDDQVSQDTVYNVAVLVRNYCNLKGMRHHHAATSDVHAIVWHFKPNLNGAGTRQRQARADE
jgi:hypothetical protein